jgi:N-acetylglutamate synthase-like GNAT family acetyltransferase
MIDDSMSVVVRSAENGDADAVFGLLSQFVVSYRAERVAFNRIFPELLLSANANLLVATSNEIVVGYALALRLATLYANGELWNLQELMVDAEHRSRGIGRILLNRVIHNAREQGAIEVVVPSRRAGGYYLNYGFVEAATLYKFKLLP